jgi:hypothetical protein
MGKPEGHSICYVGRGCRYFSPREGNKGQCCCSLAEYTGQIITEDLCLPCNVKESLRDPSKRVNRG